MDVNYEYYKIFYYVAKYNSFTKAANVLGNSQPNITRAMNCLEHEVHCTLFIRNNRGVKLTPEGEQLYRYVSSAMTQLRTAEEKLKAFQEILIGGKTFTALGSQVLSLAELKNYPLICLGRETMTYQFYHQLFLSHGIELMPDTEAATTDQILPLVKSELGLAFLPSQMAEEALKKGEIVSIQTKETIPKREICMVYDKQHPLSIAAQKLKNIIISTFPSA